MKPAAHGTTWRWVWLAGLVLCAIIVPFILFGAQLDAWTGRFLEQAAGHRLPAALVLGGLLATDILLPVPSSIVSTACGVLLGFAPGTLVSAAGMTVSCLAGYGLGAVFGRPLAVRMVGAQGLAEAQRLNRRWGEWMIIATRPVPVLAEAGVLFVATVRMPFGRFLLLSTLSNLAISLVYAAVGAYAADIHTFLPACLASIGVPGLTMLLFRRELQRARS